MTRRRPATPARRGARPELPAVLRRAGASRPRRRRVGVRRRRQPLPRLLQQRALGRATPTRGSSRPWPTRPGCSTPTPATCTSTSSSSPSGSAASLPGELSTLLLRVHRHRGQRSRRADRPGGHRQPRGDGDRALVPRQLRSGRQAVDRLVSRVGATRLAGGGRATQHLPRPVPRRRSPTSAPSTRRSSTDRSIGSTHAGHRIAAMLIDTSWDSNGVLVAPDDYVGLVAGGGPTPRRARDRRRGAGRLLPARAATSGVTPTTTSSPTS